MIIVGDKKRLLELRHRRKHLENKSSMRKLSAEEHLELLTLTRDIGVIEARETDAEVKHG